MSSSEQTPGHATLSSIFSVDDNLRSGDIRILLGIVSAYGIQRRVPLAKKAHVVVQQYALPDAMSALVRQGMKTKT